ncbi:MAG: winged helix-turn-helix domain-containing protein [bacterium]|nr:MAG: winged helix-turn-helix domain-containing protein [bacterium]
MDENIQGYQFNGIFLDTMNRELRLRGEIISLNAKYFDVLVYLVENHHRLVSKEELFEKIWTDVIVTDWALSQCIKDIRKALGDNARHPIYIKTFPKHGFMFLIEPHPVIESGNHKSQKKFSLKRPFKFLDYYAETDADIFFGRESEIENLSSKILAHRSFLLYGRSGVGKSSIIHAGIVPALKNEGHQVLVFRTFHNPTEEILEFFTNEKSGDAAIDIRDFRKYIKELTDRNIILIFDQFEQFFLHISAQIQEHFLSTLQQLLEIEPQKIKVVFVLREDHLADMNVLKKVLPEIFFNEYRLLKLSCSQAARAIIEPSRKLHFEVEKDLVDAIVDDLCDVDSIDPPQLQIVCDTLFDVRDNSSVLSLTSYLKLGGAEKILSDYLDKVVQRLDGKQSQLAKFILLTLISEDGQRQILPLDKLAFYHEDKNKQPDHLQPVISYLAEARLIRTLREEGEIWIELTHDFLVSEISRWQSEEVILLKRIQAIMERALHNYESHQLLLDEETLQLVLPLGQQLSLTDTQYDLLIQSVLNRGQTIPEWLILVSKSGFMHISQAFRNSNPDIRMAAIQSGRHLKNDQLMVLLTHHALWDEDMSVRRAAGIVLAEKYPDNYLKSMLSQETDSKAGIMRISISLAFVRDHDKRLFQLRKLPWLISMTILLGLISVRIRRSRFLISKQTIGGALGSGFAGLLVGVFLGIVLVSYRNMPAYESMTLILVLASLGLFASMFAGFGISLGLSCFRVVSYRHSPYWQIVGAILGGAGIGAILHFLGVDTFFALFGQQLKGIAGAYEGALVGLGLAAGAALGGIKGKNNLILKVSLAALGAMLAAILLTFIEGNLFSASIESIARSFADSQLKLEPLANLFGEAHFGKLSRLILGAFEGFLFGGFTVMGIELFSRKNENLTDK